MKCANRPPHYHCITQAYCCGSLWWWFWLTGWELNIWMPTCFLLWSLSLTAMLPIDCPCCCFDGEHHSHCTCVILFSKYYLSASVLSKWRHCWGLVFTLLLVVTIVSHAHIFVSTFLVMRKWRVPVCVCYVHPKYLCTCVWKFV